MLIVSNELVFLFLLQNTKELKEHVEEAKRLNDAGGDWDRRNRLKVYEAFYQLSVRNVKKAPKSSFVTKITVK